MMLPIKLVDIIEGIDAQSEELHAFLNRTTGEVIIIQEEYLRMAEDEDDPFLEDIVEWEEEEVELARKIVGSDDFIPLPDRFEIDEYRMMEDFAYGQEDDHIREILGVAIQGRGAFKRFKDAVYSKGLEKQWFKFREERMRQVAVDWCQVHGLEYEDKDSRNY